MKILEKFKEWKQGAGSAGAFVLNCIVGLFKWSWRLFKVGLVLGIVALAYGLLTDYKCHHKISPRYYVYKYDAFDKYRIKDCYKDKWVSGLLTSIDCEFGSDSLIRFSKCDLFGRNELYGYIDANTGKVAIKPQFYFAGPFSEGLAAVRKADKVGFIDTNGEFVVTMNKLVSDARRVKMCGGCAVIDIGGENGYGILSREGEWILEPKWDNIQSVVPGLYIVSGGGYNGLWSSSEGWIYGVEYDCIKAADRDEELLTITNNGRRWQIDYSGTVVRKFVFDYMQNLFYNQMGQQCVDTTTSEFAIYDIDGYIGLFNLRTNNAVTPAIYTSIVMLSDNLFEVRIYDDESILIDSKGNVVDGIN